ncbi:restriction endonuclease [Rivularia sp. UHCC 0363]|uniref:restriction endonuclease n=1 Tax=Rivularia sp. UHCC 0363 TaxID=3110244 RepID=UPI002B21B6B5|nr:restriction endonuclease [Rivularia sp. UHCC 0363]MEA5596646.1 restriction endonuclease [Rivularia sp. UHCC 0363]
MIEFLLSFIISLIILTYLINEFERQNEINEEIYEVDQMRGKQFEEYLLILFEQNGYKVELTPRSQGYGADLILYKDGLIFAVQAKRYKKPVGVKAVEEVLGSMKYHKAKKAIVITNSIFTMNADRLARSKSVILWDRRKLIKLIRRSKMKAS